MSNPNKGVVRLYACGGLGTNICAEFAHLEQLEGFASFEVCFVDTSLSNIMGKGNKIREEDIYVLDGVDGSGKMRSMNYHDIVKHVKPIMHKFKPADFNIVVSSASGGTGCVLSSLILKELLEKDHTAIAVIVGSEESKITIENTVKTLQTLDNISRTQVRKPVVVSYFHNSAQVSRQTNDDLVKKTLTALGILASRENRELDTADIANFINFSKVTSVESGLSFLYMANKEDNAKEIEYPISMASLFSQYGKTIDSVSPEYACAGYPLNDVLKESDLHFLISQHDIKNVYGKLQKRLEDFQESSSARLSAQALASAGNADDNGMIL